MRIQSNRVSNLIKQILREHDIAEQGVVVNDAQDKVKSAEDVLEVSKALRDKEENLRDTMVHTHLQLTLLEDLGIIS